MQQRKQQSWWIVVLLLCVAATLAIAAASSTSKSHHRPRRRQRLDNNNDNVKLLAAAFARDVLGVDGDVAANAGSLKANMSSAEYRQALRLYEAAAARSELLQEAWQEHLAEEQDDDEDDILGGWLRRPPPTESDSRRVQRLLPARVSSQSAESHRSKREASTQANHRLQITVEPSGDSHSEGEDLFVHRAEVAVHIVPKNNNREDQRVTLVLRHVMDGLDGSVVVDRKTVRASDVKATLDATQAADGWMLLERGASELNLEVECVGCREAGVELQEGDAVAMRVDAERGQSWTLRGRRKRAAAGGGNGGDAVAAMLFEKRGRRRKQRVHCPSSTSTSKRGGGGRRRHRRPRCCRSRREVTFAELGEEFRYVLKPHSMEVGSCGGRCPARFAHYNAHALLKSILHQQQRQKHGKQQRGRHRRGKGGSGLCCVPKKLSARPLLHLTLEGVAQVTWLKDVVADTCACA